MDVSPEAVSVSFRRGNADRFQSLFSWMFRPKSVSMLYVSSTSRDSFNPCSRGCFARSSIRLSGKANPSYIGFNPCSRGCFARSPFATIVLTMYVRRFQSLFSWMFRPKDKSMACQVSHTSDVSILVLVDVSPEDGSPIRAAYSCEYVSILVLVDVSPEAFAWLCIAVMM